mgnify:CR=1 FL=1|nr:hypothetical protein [uncultured Mediterraneibacter sp.]
MTEQERKVYYKVITQNWLAFNEFLKHGDFSEEVLVEYCGSDGVIEKIFQSNGKTNFAKDVSMAMINEIERLCNEKRNLKQS